MELGNAGKQIVHSKHRTGGKYGISNNTKKYTKRWNLGNTTKLRSRDFRTAGNVTPHAKAETLGIIKKHPAYKNR